MNNPFDYTPSAECAEAYRRLVLRLETLKESRRPEDVALWRELERGKMLGVLVAADPSGERHTLHAFSGQLGEAGFRHPDFVGPVFDYLAPDGYFKTREADISRQNSGIRRFETDFLADTRRRHEEVKSRLDGEMEEYREWCRRSKARRESRRASGDANASELASMIRQSQFEKAELRRRKKRGEVELVPFAEELRAAEAKLKEMKERRKADSEELQEWLFRNFMVLNARGESRSLKEIFADTAFGVPPSGAGECCAPKLLQEAYRRGWTPLSMAEYWYGPSKNGEVRVHGMHYPACRGKCLPVLSWMLQGLEVDPPLGEEGGRMVMEEPQVLFENEWFCVVDKPSGMLSVPGRDKGSSASGRDKWMSVQSWLEERYGPEREVRLVHRLDQDTSGLLVAAFGLDSYRTLQRLFASRQVDKTYVADLEGDYDARGLPSKGRIELSLAPDWLDRPRQRVDMENGKEAVTDYEFTGITDGRSRVVFHPRTGRTHQLRVHSASERGLGMPIVGDRLYGLPCGRSCDNDSSDSGGAARRERLHLHAHRLAFNFPLDGLRHEFESPLPF